MKIVKNKFFKLAFKIILSVFFIGLLIIKVDWIESWQYLRKIEVWQIVIYLAVIFLSLSLSAKKWQELCFFKGLHDSFLNYFKLYLTGAFINNFVPSTIGGDIFRAYEIGKKEKKYSQATATVVMDRFTGLLALMFMSPIFFLLNFSRVGGVYLIGLSSIIILGALIAFFILWKTKKTVWMRKVLTYMPERVTNFFKELSDFGSNWKIFSRAMIYSFLFNLIGVGLANLILFWSLGINVDVLDYFSVIFVISIVASIPAGVGLKEWAYIAFFVPLGISVPGAVTVAILNRFLQALVNAVALPIYLRSKKL
jgi:glycosyltransferase 2 family protein